MIYWRVALGVVFPRVHPIIADPQRSGLNIGNIKLTQPVLKTMPKARTADRWSVITHRREGKTKAEIVRITGFTKPFVSRWANAADEGRDAEDKPRLGRPPKVTAAVRRQIKRMVKDKERASIRKVAAAAGLSKETVRMVNKQHGLHPYHKRKRPHLTDDQRRRRLGFARKYSKHDWRATLMTDERIFNLFPPGNTKNDVVWSDSADSVPPRQRVAKSAGFMVWGGIS